MPTVTTSYPAGDQRVSDADRDQAVCALSEAFQEGRITRDEFEQRSGQALSARTGNDLAALFTDLQAAPAPAPAIRGGPGRARALATWAGVTASAAAAIPLAAVAASNALARGPSLAQREAQRKAAEQVLAHQGLKISVPLPPARGFDWVGTITPAAFAVLAVVLIAVLVTLSRRASLRSRPGARLS